MFYKDRRLTTGKSRSKTNNTFGIECVSSTSSFCSVANHSIPAGLPLHYPNTLQRVDKGKKKLFDVALVAHEFLLQINAKHYLKKIGKRWIVQCKATSKRLMFPAQKIRNLKW